MKDGLLKNPQTSLILSSYFWVKKTKTYQNVSSRIHSSCARPSAKTGMRTWKRIKAFNHSIILYNPYVNICLFVFLPFLLFLWSHALSSKSLSLCISSNHGWWWRMSTPRWGYLGDTYRSMQLWECINIIMKKTLLSPRKTPIFENNKSFWEICLNMVWLLNSDTFLK